jgi:hypothetical protein
VAVGFASLGSFSGRFSQLMGESPTAYRNRWAARGGPHVPGCVEAVMRDNAGNWLVLVEPRGFTPEDFK